MNTDTNSRMLKKCCTNRIGLYVALWLLCLAIMLPTLLQPHWGMFSDYIQIVECCQKLSRSANIHDWLIEACEDLRPGAHLPDYLTWAISPNNPFLFYLLRFFCLALTLSLTFYSSLILSKSRSISFLATIFWLLAKPTYEVIYTLDKGEIFVALLFALIIAINLHSQSSRRSDSKVVSTQNLALGFSLLYCVFTKQTGQLVIFYAAANYLAFKLANKFINESPDEISEDRSKSASQRNYQESLFFILSLISCGLYQLFYRLNGGLQFKRYNEMDYLASSMIGRLCDYSRAMPECSALFGVTILGIVGIIIGSYLNKSTSKTRLIPLISSTVLIATTATGAIGLCGWQTKILYIWFPLLAFLLPASAFALEFVRKKFSLLTFGMLAGAIIWLAPQRFVDAQKQLALDSLFSKLTSKLVTTVESKKSRLFIMFPFNRSDAFEIGNTVRAAAQNSLKLLGQSTQDIQVSNISRAYFSNSPQSSLETITRAYAPEPGIEKLTQTNNGSWLAERVNIGDIILVPFGNVETSGLDYRGIELFEITLRKSFGWLKQLEPIPLFTISTQIKQLNKPTMSMNWQALAVTRTPPISVETIDGGWLLNQSRIECSPSLIGHSVLLTARKSHRLRELLLNSNGSVSDLKSVDIGNQSLFRIPVLSVLERIEAQHTKEKALLTVEDLKVE